MTEKKTATKRILELIGDSIKKGESFSLENQQVTELFDEIGFEILTPTYKTYGEDYIQELSDEHENLEAFKRHILLSFIELVRKESVNEYGIFTGEAKDIQFVFTKKPDLCDESEEEEEGYKPFQLNGTWYIETIEHTTPVYMKRSVAEAKYPNGCWMELEENEGKEEEDLKDDDLVFDTFCDLIRCDKNGNEIAGGMDLGDFCEFYDIDIEDTDSVG